MRHAHADARAHPRRTATARAVMLLMALGGCANAVPGGSTYSCAGMPEGVVCSGARDMHTLTTDRDRIDAAVLEALAEDAAEGTSVAARSASSQPREGRLDPAVVAGTPLVPQPVAMLDDDAAARRPNRHGSGVVRIWIAPWEDQHGHLRMPGYVFAEVRPGRWNLSSRPSHLTANHLQTPAMIEARETPGQPLPPRGGDGAAGRGGTAQPDGARRQPAPPGPSQRSGQPQIREVRS